MLQYHHIDALLTLHHLHRHFIWPGFSAYLPAELVHKTEFRSRSSLDRTSDCAFDYLSDVDEPVYNCPTVDYKAVRAKLNQAKQY